MNYARRAFLFQAVVCSSIWLRHNLESFKNRLAALKAKVESERIILTDEQVAALEKKKQDDEVCSEIETQHPDYLGSQDTFYVGNLKGVGRIYQQTSFICTASSICQALHNENAD